MITITPFILLFALFVALYKDLIGKSLLNMKRAHFLIKKTIKTKTLSDIQRRMVSYHE
jgi:hypothetical protein